MAEGCRIVAYVRGRRVVAAAHEVRGIEPCATGLSSPIEVHVRRVEVEYGWRFDPSQASALNEARRLAAETRSPLRVVDLGRANPLVRAVRLLRLGGRTLPVVIMKGSCPWHRLAESEPSEVPAGARSRAGAAAAIDSR